MKITPNKSGKSDFLRTYTQAFSDTLLAEKGDAKRLHQLRCSQLPYCPVSTVLNYGQRGLFQVMDLGMAYYVGVGHAVHNVMQRYLSQSGNFLADYHCAECGKKYPLSHTIECCEFPTKYDEVSLLYKGVGGHIDGIFKDSQGQYWIVDFKTCSVEGAMEKSRRPPAGYMYQVRAYALLLLRQYGLRVAGVMLIFIPRDNPRAPTIWEERFTDRDFDAAGAMLKQELAKHRLAMQAETFDDLKNLIKNYRCVNEYCRYCRRPTSELNNIAKLVVSQRKLPIGTGI